VKRILLACLVLLALAGVTSAVPYPYKDYDLPTTGDLAAIEQEVRGKYTVYAGSETGSFHSWDSLSYAMLQAPVENDSRGGYIFDNNHENSSWILLTLEIYSCIM